LVADGSKWNFTNVFTETTNGVLSNSSTNNGTMVFASAGTVTVSVVGSLLVTLNWTATTQNLTLTDPTGANEVSVYKITESFSKLIRFSGESTIIAAGNTIVGKENYTLTK
jgi:hypothetical protein